VGEGSRHAIGGEKAKKKLQKNRTPEGEGGDLKRVGEIWNEKKSTSKRTGKRKGQRKEIDKKNKKKRKSQRKMKKTKASTSKTVCPDGVQHLGDWSQGKGEKGYSAYKNKKTCREKRIGKRQRGDS